MSRYLNRLLDEIRDELADPGGDGYSFLSDLLHRYDSRDVQIAPLDDLLKCSECGCNEVDTFGGVDVCGSCRATESGLGDD